MYGKIFASMYDGSLHGHWEALVTFQQLIVLSDVDGVCDMTIAAIAARTSIPSEIIAKGIEYLEQVDPESRSREADGRRIERIDPHRNWGWIVVNKAKYRDLKDYDEVRRQNRIRQQRHREKLKLIQGGAKDEEEVSRDVTRRNVTSRHTDTDTHADADTKIPPYGGVAAPRDLFGLTAEPPEDPGDVIRTKKGHVIPFKKIVDLYHEILPMLPRVKLLTAKRRNAVKARWVESPERQSLDWWRKYFTYIATKCHFLHGTNDRNWRADFDFIVRDSGMTGIIEGKYARIVTAQRRG